jgi:hypothetical protein
MAWVLVIHDNEEMLGFLEGAVLGALAGRTCRTARNIADGRKLLSDWGRRDCVLVVSSLTARLDASHVPDAQRHELTGIDFIREIRGDDAGGPPALLVASLIDTVRAASLAEVPNARLLSAQDLFGNLEAELRTAVQFGLGKPKYRVDLDIVLRTGQQCRWSMKGSGGIGIEDADVMDISRAELETLENLSQPAGGADDKFLESLGLNVYKVLMADALKSGDLEMKLRDSVKNVGGMSVARIRFNVDQSTHRIHLETLAKPTRRDGSPEFWMLKTPMFRKFGDRGGRLPLFKDRASQTGRIHCLVIEGKTDQFAVGAPFTRAFPALKGAAAETTWLETFLADPGRDNVQVTVLRHAGFAAGTFVDAIKQELSTGHYNLVHYAGHSAIDKSSSGAYLLLGGHANDLLPAAEFSSWASSVQFVFLSSCQSANSQFVMKLVETAVPAVAGFAWQVSDAIALKFSQAFYGILFGTDRDSRYLEYAFMRAKQELHRAYPATSHWVAPLLFLQVFDAERTDAAA